MIELIKKSISLLEKNSSLFENNASFNYRSTAVLFTLKFIESSDDELRKKCKYFFSKHEKDLLEKLKLLNDDLNNINCNVEDIYILCGYLVSEYKMYTEVYTETWLKYLNPKVKDLYNKFINDDHSFINNENNVLLQDIKSKRFDVLVALYYFYSFKSFEKYESLVKKGDKLKSEMESKVDYFSGKINELINTVNELEKQLEKQRTELNFVGLSKGFENLLSKKRWAKWASFSVMTIFCILLITVPILFFGGRFLNWFSAYNLQWNDIGWEHMLPVFGLEFVLIYFFRVSLNYYNSIQTQIIQIELRLSLCQFIENYSDFAKRIKENDGASLEKFENLIFSSILSTPDKVPSTFDGLEQLSNLIKNMKSGN